MCDWDVPVLPSVDWQQHQRGWGTGDLAEATMVALPCPLILKISTIVMQAHGGIDT